VYVDVTDNAEVGLYLGLAIVPADGTLSSFAAGSNAPASSASWGALGDWGYGSLGQGEFWAMAHVSTAPVYPDGEWLTASWALDGTATSAVVSLYELYETGGETFLDSVTVPEPMTVLLLSLGGLFLRRRK
jgi:hypothetical protein